MAVEYDFLRALSILSETHQKGLYKKRAKELINHALTRHNAYYPYRLAVELDRRGYSTVKLEDYIIKLSKNSKFNERYLLTVPMNVGQANINKFEKAVIDSKNAELMAEFSCFVHGCNDKLLEDLVLSLRIPRASYLFLSFAGATCQIDKHKEVLISSKKSRYLYKCAQISSNTEEFSRIEDLILNNKSNLYIRLLASLPNSDKEKIENKIISTANFEEIKKLYKVTKSLRLAKYVILM